MMPYYVRLCSMPVTQLFAFTAGMPQHSRSEEEAELRGFQPLNSSGKQNKTHILGGERKEGGSRGDGSKGKCPNTISLSPPNRPISHLFLP